MEVISVEYYRDGGTRKINLKEDEIEKSYFIDYRIGSLTAGKIYSAYPDEKDAVILELKEEELIKILNALCNYYEKIYWEVKNENYDLKSKIDNLLHY